MESPDEDTGANDKVDDDEDDDLELPRGAKLPSPGLEVEEDQEEHSIEGWLVD